MQRWNTKFKECQTKSCKKCQWKQVKPIMNWRYEDDENEYKTKIIKREREEWTIEEQWSKWKENKSE